MQRAVLATLVMLVIGKRMEGEIDKQYDIHTLSLAPDAIFQGDQHDQGGQRCLGNPIAKERSQILPEYLKLNSLDAKRAEVRVGEVSSDPPSLSGTTCR